jgi:LPS-assembly protein
MKDPRGEVEAEAAHLNIEDETGWLEEGRVVLPRHQYILTGKRLEKSYGQSYRIENGSFTTCQCEETAKPDWSVSAREVEVTQGGRGVVHGGVVKVRDTPVLYLPYGIFSVRTERQSGFLFPRYGFSSKRGFQWEQPFFWAISKSQDVTFTADFETAARGGALGEYRYALSKQTQGQLDVSYFNEQVRGPAGSAAPVDRWSLTGTHRQQLPRGWDLYGDLFFTSDNQFLREINLPVYPRYSDWDLRTRRFTDSPVGVLKTWDRALLRTETVYYQDLVQDDDFAFQVLPRVHFRGQQGLWHNRFVAGLNVEGVDFYRPEGFDGQRLDIAPTLALPFHFGGLAFGSFSVTGRETLYRLSSEQEVDFLAQGSPTLTGKKLSGDRTREIVELSWGIGTRLARVFDLGWGRLLKLQHVIEPELTYLYVPLVGQNDLPLFDELDRINKRSLFVYGVTNRLWGKFATDTEGQTEVRELARFSVYQAYDPSRKIARGEENFSDLDFHARLLPLRFSSLSLDSTYNVALADVTAMRLGLWLQDPRPLPPANPALQLLQQRSTLGLSYRLITDRLLKELNVHALLHLTDSFYLGYTGRYDANASDFIGNHYFFRYISAQKCWSLDLALIDKVNPQETEFRFSLNLLGLTSLGREVF